MPFLHLCIIHSKRKYAHALIPEQEPPPPPNDAPVLHGWRDMKQTHKPLCCWCVVVECFSADMWNQYLGLFISHLSLALLGYASEELASVEIIRQITDSVKASLDLTLTLVPFSEHSSLSAPHPPADALRQLSPNKHLSYEASLIFSFAACSLIAVINGH